MFSNITIGKKERKMIFTIAVFFFLFAIVPSFLNEHSKKYYSKTLNEKQNLSSNVNVLKEDLEGIDKKKEVLKKYIDTYQTLIDKNAMVSPSHVELVKVMKLIANTRRQNAVKFSFDDIIKNKPDSSIYTKGSNAFIEMHPLEISMPMLHDLDIYMFIESLESRTDYLFYPVRCEMERLSDQFSLSDKNNMIGFCRLVLYSINDPDRKIEKKQ